MEQQVQINKSKFKPYCSALLFLSYIIKKKASTWILFILSIILIFLITITPTIAKFVQKGDIPPGGLKSACSLTIVIVLSIQMMFAIIHGISKSVNIFSDPQKEGVEIILVTKPITRYQLLISRYLFLLFYGLIVTTQQTSLVTIGALINGYANYNMGALIGSSIIITLFPFIFFCLLTSFLASFAGPKISIMISMIILFVSSIISGITGVLGIDTQNRKIKNNLLRSPAVVNKIREIIPQEKEIQSIYSYDALFIFDKDTSTAKINLNASINVRIKGNFWSKSIFLSDQQNGLADILNKEFINTYKRTNLTASWSVAIDYLNPLSMFNSFANVQQFETNNLGNYPSVSPEEIFSYTRGFKYNFTYYVDKSVNENDKEIKMKSIQANPNWAVALCVLGQMSIFVALASVKYKRKDFK